MVKKETEGEARIIDLDCENMKYFFWLALLYLLELNLSIQTLKQLQREITSKYGYN
jgi:hypothetical protein